MAISATYIGTGTLQITASGLQNDFTALTNAVADAFLGTQPAAVGVNSGITFAAAAGVTAAATTGWTLADSFTSGIIFTQVFQARNKDGVSYKNIIVRWNTQEQVINTSTCEAWDVVTHTATNEAYTFQDCAALGYKTLAFDLILIVNPRMACLHSFIQGDAGLWSGVFENAREDALDTAASGYPCWGWMSSTLWTLGATSYNTTPLQGLGSPLINMPRTRTGATGVNAAKSWAADYGVTQYPQWLSPTVMAFITQIGSAGGKFLTSAWDTTKRLVMPIKPMADFTTAAPANYGTLFGVKVLSNAGADMSKIKVTVDSDGNFSPAGTLQDHWLLNCHHRPQNAIPAAWFGNSSVVTTNYPVTGGIVENFVSTGAAYYCVTTGPNNSLVKVIAATGANVNILTMTGGAKINDLRFDGEKYIYFGTGTGLRRLDISTDTVSAELVLAGGVQHTAINGTHILCTPYTATATPTLTRVLRSTFLVDTTNGSLLLGSFTETVRLVETLTDWDGNFFVTWAAAAAVNHRVIKVTPAGVVSLLDLRRILSSGVALYQVDADTIWMVQIVESSQAAYTSFSPKTGVVKNTDSCFPGVTQVIGQKGVILKIGGVIAAFPRSTSGSQITGRSSLGYNLTSTMTTPIVSEDIYSSAGGSTSSTAGSIYMYDGCKLVSNSPSGLRILTNLHATPTTGVTLGQVALVA